MREGSIFLGVLRRALAASEDTRTKVAFLRLRLEDYGDNVRRQLEALERADAVIISTAAYHGTPDEEGNVTDAHVGRLEKLGRLVVNLAERLSPEGRGTRSRITHPAPVGIAS